MGRSEAPSAGRRLRATVEYDGTDFSGWQRQPDQRTVQATIETALSSLEGDGVRVVAAGRTDTGVHASGQVVHFDTQWARGLDELLRAANAVLPRDVALRDLGPAPEGFHARHSAIARAYRYTLWVGPVRSPLERRWSLHLPQSLDLPAMDEAAGHFEGLHDFAAFGKPMRPGGVTLRRVDRVRVLRQDPFVRIEVEGNAFLRHMVRRMVGVLIDVGRGHSQPGAIASALAGDAASVKPRRVPAQGLVLTAVRYPPDEKIQPRRPAGRDEGETSREDL